LDIRIVYGKTELQPGEHDWISKLSSVRLSFCTNLHAKCYLSEASALVTSMNLYEFSQVNNHEMGISLTKAEDPALYNAVYEEAQRLLRISNETRINIETVKEQTKERRKRDDRQ